MKYVSNHNNVLRGAVLTALGILASAAMYRTGMTREGGGQVRMTGAYTGQHDATFDVEIVNNTIGGVPQVSAPTFVGVGNGAMTGVAADAGTDAQAVTATLINRGTETRRAYAQFQGVTLRAIATGTAGNAITVSVDDSGIVRTATQHSLLQDIRRDSNEMIGDEWNFGHVQLNPDGTIPTSAPRIAFGDDPQVYRAYKEYLEGRYVYRLSPVPVRDVQAGAKVYAVTGTRTVTISDGVDTDVYAGVTTLYSLLAQIEGDADALVDVVEPVTVDLAPGGMGIDEMSVRTTSFLATLAREGTQYARDADIGFEVAATAPTEAISLRCASADYPGAERWDVIGTVSGVLARATTGVEYDGAQYDFLIPVALPPAQAPSATSLARLDLLSRSDTEREPSLCYRDLRLGAEAQTKTFTFVWAKRPPESCVCDPASIVGQPNDDILGIDDEEGGDTMATIPEELRERYDALYEWRRDFIAANTSIASADSDEENADKDQRPVITDAQSGDGESVQIRTRISATLKVDRLDIDAANRAVAIFRKGLDEIYPTGTGDINADAAAEWDAAFSELQADFEDLEENIGAEFWRNRARYMNYNAAYQPEGHQSAAAFGPQMLTQVLDAFLLRYASRMDYAKVLMGIAPDFDDATLPGNEVWQDHGAPMWFRSLDDLLPLQPGFYYHSARMSSGDDPVPVSTRQFGIGVAIGCPELLKEGDRLIIEITVDGNLRQTYQVGDAFNIEVIRATPVPFGGGQTGDDTLTWRVVGSVDGALAEYELLRTAPEAYDDGGISFLITPGGVAFELGDRFTFNVEGGEARWRKDGGSWSTIPIAPTVAISDGITLAFDAGAAPSFVPGDAFAFAAEAVNGPDNLATLLPTRLRASGSPSTITITPATPRVVSAIYIGAHTLPADATLTLQGSNASDFSAIAWSESIAPQAGADIYREFAPSPSLAYFRLQVTAGSYEIGWLWLGDAPVEMATMRGARELGRLTRRHRLPTALARAALGARVEHEALSHDSVAALLEVLDHAAANEGGRLAIVCNEQNEPRANAIVEIDGESVEVTDEFDFQPRDTARRWQSVSLDLRAAA